MAKSANWMRHSVLAYLETLLDELVPDTIDAVTMDPKGPELNDRYRTVFIRGGDDTLEITGSPGEVDLTASIMIRCFAPAIKTESIQLTLESMVASVRDQIADHIDAFHTLDPACQVEAMSLVDDPAYAHERDLSAATIQLTVRSHY